MSDSPPGLDAGLRAVAALLGPDGARVAVLSWEAGDGTLSLRLDLDSADCAACVVPRPLLDTLLLDSLRRHAPAVRAVQLDDPRDRSGP